jgi:site-specific DNA recombinase
MDFRTRSGKRMTLSSIYLVLKNTYYYGYFEYPVGSGNWYKGEHEPIITKETFDEAQIQLTVAPKSKPGTKEFSFTKMIKCGSCGSGVTAEEKYKKLSDGSVKKYIYYHCSRFNDLKCKESYIREENLTIQLIKLIDRIDMDQLKTQKRIKEEIDRYQKFTKNILGVDNKIKMPEINMKDYARYVLTDGTREEIRELFNCLDTELKLKEQKIYI